MLAELMQAEALGEQQIEQRSLVPGFEDQEKNSKWIRSFRCGCDECRFIAPAQRQPCPLENSSAAIWLWTMNNDYISRLDYVDNYPGTGPREELDEPDLLAEVEANRELP